MIYLDVSALMTLVTQRANVAELDDFLLAHAEFRGATSTVGMIETVRNCDRVGNFPNLMGRLLCDYDELQVTAQVRDRPANLPGRLKALDAIHVATAESLGEDLAGFVTYDRQMAAVARSLGLPAASPGMESWH